MSEEEIQAALAARDRWVILSTVGGDGFPHSVPVGYFLLGGLLIIGCQDGSQKIRNIERNPKVSLLWENGKDSTRLQGILFQGEARIIRDRADRLALKSAICQERGESPPSEVAEGAVYLEITPTKTISWNRPRRGLS